MGSYQLYGLRRITNLLLNYSWGSIKFLYKRHYKTLPASENSLNSAQVLLHDHVPRKCYLLAVMIPVSLSDHEDLEPLFTVAEGVQIHQGGKHGFQVNNQTPPCIKESSVMRSRLKFRSGLDRKMDRKSFR